MKFRKNKNLVFIILLLFVGQVISAPFSVCSSSNSQDSHSMSIMNMSSMSNHDMTLMQDYKVADSSNEMDCCADDCDCPLGICLSFALYINLITDFNFNTSSNYFDISNQITIKQTISSIYRPPIFC